MILATEEWNNQFGFKQVIIRIQSQGNQLTGLTSLLSIFGMLFDYKVQLCN